MEYLPIILKVTLIHFLAVVSPGPDFIMCLRNSLTYSRKTGIWTALGIGSGISVHIFYSLAGFSLIVSRSILLFNSIKLLGAIYLIYIGIKTFLSKSSKIDVGEQSKEADISPSAAFKMGFMTNVLNPKATMFFLSLFTLVISPDTPSHIMAVISVILVVNTALWFTLVAVFMTQKGIRSIFERYQNAFNRGFGALLIAVGIKVALMEK